MAGKRIIHDAWYRNFLNTINKKAGRHSQTGVHGEGKGWLKWKHIGMSQTNKIQRRAPIDLD